MTSERIITARTDRLKRYMDELFPEPRKHRRLPPLDELILTILSQNTSDLNSQGAYESLTAKFPTWDAVANARWQDVAAAIRHGGLAEQKAPRIISILNAIKAERGGYDLSHLKKMSVEEGLQYLTSFNGVGMKTASCVLLFSLRKPAFPVDTHILRVSQRLGIVALKDSADKAVRVYMAHTEPDCRLKFHIDIIMFGRQICHARNPECEICKLRRWCLYYKGELN